MASQDTRDELKRRVADVASKSAGRDTTTTIAWVTREEWAIVPPKSVQLARQGLQKSARIEPTVVITAETSRHDNSVEVSVSERDHTGDLPDSARLESLADGLELDDDSLADSSLKELAALCRELSIS